MSADAVLPTGHPRPRAVDRMWAVIPAGGAGTRLWPVSRAASPKFLHDLTGRGRTLIQDTHDRLAPLVGQRVLVVTGVAHSDAVREQLPDLSAAQVVAEPSPRDSMAAIALAAATVERDDPEGLIGSFAADHVIADPERFRAAVAEAAEVALTGRLVTIGIHPTEPATGFGYIRSGPSLEPFATACEVLEFVEKPALAKAREYVVSGTYRWNAGMFVVRATVLLDLLAENHPDLAAGVRAIAADPTSLAERWDDLEKIAIDHAVAEPAAAAGKVAVVPGDFGWEDIGDFATLSSLLRGEGGLRVLGDAARVVMQDASGFVVPESGRVVAVLGLDDIVVVDTPDALLVTTRERAQEVKAVVEELRARGLTELL